MTLVATALVFSDASQQLMTGAAGELIWDNINKRLGIGIAAPATPLHVIGDVTVTGNFLTSKKVGYFTRDISLASGTQAITGIGFKPSGIIFIAIVGGAASRASWGFASSSTAADNQVIVDYGLVAADSYANSSNYCIYIFTDATGNVYAVAAISSFDSDGFTLTWTKTGSPTGTAVINYMAFR